MVEGEEALIVRTEGRIKSLADVKATVVDNQQGLSITVGDVADVAIGALTRYGSVTKDGKGRSGDRLGVKYAWRKCAANHRRAGKEIG